MPELGSETNRAATGCLRPCIYMKNFKHPDKSQNGTGSSALRVQARLQKGTTYL